MAEKKLLQIVVEGNTGSTGTIAESIGKVAMSHGWESIIAFGRFSRPSESKLYKIGSKLDFLWHVLYTRLTDAHGFASRRATRNLVRFIKRERPSVVHLHHIHGYYVNIELLFDFLSKYSIPVVWTFHDCWSFTGHCSHFDDIGCYKWETECHNCPQLGEYPKSIFRDRSRQNFQDKRRLFNSVSDLTIVSVSKWLDALVGRSFLKANRHFVIYNGVDTDVFTILPKDEIQSLKIEFPQKFTILGVSSIWNRKKGYDDFLEISRMLKSDEQLIMIGLSDDQLKELPDNILGIRKTENVSQLVKYYNFAQVFVNASIEETFGLTTAESLACGTPAIVYDATACPEVIDDQTGLVVQKGSVSGLRKAIDEIKLKGKDFYAKNCRARAVDCFDKRDRYAEYISLYQELTEIK